MFWLELTGSCAVLDKPLKKTLRNLTEQVWQSLIPER
jgi:hypothetical protein